MKASLFNKENVNVGKLKGMKFSELVRFLFKSNSFPSYKNKDLLKEHSGTGSPIYIYIYIFK